MIIPEHFRGNAEYIYDTLESSEFKLKDDETRVIHITNILASIAKQWENDYKEALDEIAQYILPVQKISGVDYVEWRLVEHLRNIARNALKK